MVDPRLKELADLLPATVAGALAKSTCKGYTYGVLKFKKWANTYMKKCLFYRQNQFILLYI